MSDSAPLGLLVAIAVFVVAGVAGRGPLARFGMAKAVPGLAGAGVVVGFLVAAG